MDSYFADRFREPLRQYILYVFHIQYYDCTQERGIAKWMRRALNANEFYLLATPTLCAESQVCKWYNPGLKEKEG